MMIDIEPKILSVQQVFKLDNLSLPDYQRPYKWTKENVQQLLQDIYGYFVSKKSRYRLGVLVLHQNNKKDIVDGQQRLTTLALILNTLGQETNFLNQTFNHSQSHKNIIENHQYICHYFDNNPDLKDDNKFKDYILNQCELVCVTLKELDEAFQYFDSQNSKGKSLEPYDLLKAFHLRAMSNNESKLLNYVEYWENAVNENPTLKVIISAILYRIRQWHRDNDAELFTSKHLNVFKGVDKSSNFPYLLAQKAAMALYQAKSINPMLYADDFSSPAFQSTQTLLNGQEFFEYIAHYRQKYQELFDNKSGILAHRMIDNRCILDILTYKGCQRTGDGYVRNLFECTLLLYYDKFGNNDLEIVIKKILMWAYQVRFKWEKIYWGRIDTTAKDKNGLLHCILLAKSPIEVINFMTPKLLDKEIKRDIPELRVLIN